MSQMSLNHLLKQLNMSAQDVDIDLSNISLDSRTIKPSGLFLAYPGVQFDGRDFISQAFNHGAVAILAEKNNSQLNSMNSSIPIIHIENLAQKLGLIAATFYGDPSAKLPTFGITGTNGKTSCCYFLAESLHYLGKKCGVIGTLGTGLYGHINESHLTTPDALTLQSLFASFLQQQADAVAMEVSSHSIAQGRINELNFAVGIFTNLSRDHLDYHGTMENYAQVKSQFIASDQVKTAVINADDERGLALIERLAPTKNVYAYTLNNHWQSNVPIVRAASYHCQLTGMSIQIESPWGQGEIVTSIIGRFNISNILAVLTALCLLGYDLAEVCFALSRLTGVPGRMQSFGGGKLPLVMVDFSHTPDSLEKALGVLREHCTGRLFCLFGCGGNRDRGKRPLMAQMAERYADVVMVTDDNPRDEDSQQIIAEIMLGFNRPQQVLIEPSRQDAIKKIISIATANDCVLIAGRGGEKYQMVKGQPIPFDDGQVVSHVLFELSENAV